MSIFFQPDKYVKKIAPRKKIRNILKVSDGNAKIKRAALGFVDDLDFINKKKVAEVALKVVASYKARLAKEFEQEGIKDMTALGKEFVADPRLLIQRVQNEMIFQTHEAIKTKYAGKKARWLPSSAEEPRPIHQTYYGRVYTIGEGIDGVEPGDEYGCQCGVEILTDETELSLD